MCSSTSSPTKLIGRFIPSLCSLLLAAALLAAAPCLAVSGGLPPAAAVSRDLGLAAAGRGDFASAIRDLGEAQRKAPFAPELIYNLGVANQQSGNFAAAALWYRAFLTAAPGWDGLEDVRSEIGLLADDLEANARQKFAEAEELALVLSAERPGGSGRSLRRAALDSILKNAYFFGPAELGAQIAERVAASVPGEEQDIGVSRVQQFQGLWGIANALDDNQAVILRITLGDRGGAPILDGSMAQMYAQLGEARESLTWLAGYDAKDLTKAYAVPYITSALQRFGAFSEAEELFARLGKVGYFSPVLFNSWLEMAESAFWRGDPAAARRLALGALEYHRLAPEYDRVYGTYNSSCLLAQALAGDWEKVETTIRGNNLLYQQGSWIVSDRVAGVAALAAPDRGKKLIPLIYRQLIFVNSTSTDSQEPDGPLARKVHAENPMGDIALAIANANDAAVLAKVALWGAEPTRKDGRFVNNELFLKRTLELAVAAGRSELALAVAPLDPDGEHAASQMRLLAARGDAKVKERAAELTRGLWGGYEPLPEKLQRRILALTGKAREYQTDAAEYTPVPQELERIAAETPELLPEKLSWYGGEAYEAALAARAQ